MKKHCKHCFGIHRVHNIAYFYKTNAYFIPFDRRSKLLHTWNIGAIFKVNFVGYAETIFPVPTLIFDTTDPGRANT